jgi:hypothetical protein
MLGIPNGRALNPFHEMAIGNRENRFYKGSLQREFTNDPVNLHRPLRRIVLSNRCRRFERLFGDLVIMKVVANAAETCPPLFLNFV